MATQISFISQVLPAGGYGLVASRVGSQGALFPYTSSADVITDAQALGLAGLAFRLFDSTSQASRWAPDQNGANWQQVQWLFSLPGFVSDLRAAGLYVVGCSTLGPYGRTAIANEIALMKWIHDTYQDNGHNLQVAGWVFDVTNSDWGTNDKGKLTPNVCQGTCVGQYLSTLVHWAERVTRGYFPIFLRAPQLGSDRSLIWPVIIGDRGLAKTFIMPTLAHGSMSQGDYQTSYSSYQLAGQIQDEPRLEYCLDLHGANATEAIDVVNSFGSNAGSAGPHPATGITVVSSGVNITPSVGFVLLDDLETMTSTETGGVMRGAFAPVYWDFDIADGTSPVVFRFGVYSYQLLDSNGNEVQFIPMTVGQPVTFSLFFHSLKFGIPGFSTANWEGGSGLQDGSTWMLANGASTAGTTVVHGSTPTFTGTPPNSNPQAFVMFPQVGLSGAGTTTVVIPIIAMAHSEYTGGSFSGSVTGGSPHQPTPATDARTLWSLFPPFVYDGDFQTGVTWVSPWTVSASPGSGGVIGPGEGTGGGVFGEGPTTCFNYGGSGCNTSQFCVDNDLLNTVFSALQGNLTDFNLDFWALAIAIIFHESGWSTNNTHCETADVTASSGAVGSQGLWQIEIFTADHDQPCPGQGPMSDAQIAAYGPDSLWVRLIDAYFNTVQAIIKIRDQGMIAQVNAASGGWGNLQAINDAFGGTWSSVRFGSVLTTYNCIRSSVKAQTWPLTSSGATVFCPIHAQITCNYDNGVRPDTCGANGTYPGHLGTDFSCAGGSNYTINHGDPDPHNWTDVSGPPACGQVSAPVKGQVVFAGLDPRSDFNHDGPGLGQLGSYEHGLGYGYYIDIEEETQLRLVRLAHFNHADFLLVATGDHVEMGQAISTGLGSRGNASGTHTHMEVFTRSSPSGTYARIDPSTVLPSGCP